jgi:hypothetical protein
MNNQFSGPTAWNDYLAALEKAAPVIEAIATVDAVYALDQDMLVRSVGSDAAKLVRAAEANGRPAR